MLDSAVTTTYPHDDVPQRNGVNMARPETSPYALLLEDDECDAAITQELLEKFCRKKYTVKRARILSEALRLLTRGRFDIALLDMNVPDCSGLETVRRAIQANPDVPAVVLSGVDDYDTAIGALHAGAQDYLPKSQLDNRTLDRIIEYSIQRKNNETGFAAKAHFDAQTGLVNRAYLYDRWRRSLARSKRAGSKIGILVADIQGLKQINDNYSHAAGDAVLRDVADTFTKSVGETDIVARLGGDEFIVVLESVQQKSEVETACKTLATALRGYVEFDGRKIDYCVNIGGALSDPHDQEDLMAALKRADAEMYEFDAFRYAGSA